LFGLKLIFRKTAKKKKMEWVCLEGLNAVDRGYQHVIVEIATVNAY
jgi:hypothetical protein